jgi:hypothetical protein
MTLRRLFRRSARPRIAEALREVEDGLTGLAHSTEADFLAVGSRLEQILREARDAAGKLAGMLTPADAGGESALAQLLEQAHGRCGEAGSHIEGERWFAELAPLVHTAGQPLQDLLDTVRVLRVLGMTTRVESARLGERSGNFEALAAEVRNLADGIEEKAGSLLEARKELTALLARARAAASGHERKRYDEMRRLTTECAAEAGEMQREREKVMEMSAGARHDYEQVAESVNTLVQNLQVHDSVRQRFEHIVSGLAEIRSGRGRASEVALQTAQLQQARKSFLAAVEQIRTELDRIAETALGYRTLAEQFSRDAAGDLQNHLLSIGSALAETAQSQNELSKVAQEVNAACARMCGFVRDIEGLGERLLRLALNAEVQAVHLQAAGAVMESVAEQIRLVSQSASESARSAGAALRELEAPAGRMVAALQSESSRDAAAGIQDRVRGAEQETETCRWEGRRLLDSVTESSDSLARQIQTLREGIRAGETADRVTDECLQKLAAVISGMGESVAIGVSHDASTNYTMHSEREVHAAFVAGRSDEVVAEAEFGDNVELF